MTSEAAVHKSLAPCNNYNITLINLRVKLLIHRCCCACQFFDLDLIAFILWWWRLITRLGDFNDRVNHFSFSRLNWSQGILIHLLSQPGLILSNQQIHVMNNYSK